MLHSSSHRVNQLQDSKLSNSNQDNSLLSSLDNSLAHNLDNSNSLASNQDNSNSLAHNLDNNNSLASNLDNNSRLSPTLTVFQPVLIVRVSTHSSTQLTPPTVSCSPLNSSNLFNLHLPHSNSQLDNLPQPSFPSNNNLPNHLYPIHHSLSNREHKLNNNLFNQPSPAQPSDNLNNNLQP